MDSLIRIVKTPNLDMNWSFQLKSAQAGQYELKTVRTDGSGGWSQTFFVSVQNHLGEKQNIEIQSSTGNELLQTICPYIDFRLKPQREFWKIPPLIFQTWKSGPKTPEMEAALKSFQTQAGYTHVCWDDNTCYKFIHQAFGERYAKAYQLLVPGSYRADFWRYCVLYKFGGVYSDAKATLMRPLDEIIRPADDLILVRDIPRTCLLNGFIACRPAHPLIKLVLEMSLEKIEARSYGTDPLDITGPHIFGRAFCRWKGFEEDSMNLEMGVTETTQILGRSDDKKYIISPEGERLLQKEYDTYYKNDMDVKFHYPQLWAYRAIYGDQPPWNQTPAS